MSSPFLGDILLRKTSTSMSSTRARSNGFISNLPDCKFAATNPKIRQFFCNEAPKKNYKNFYPKEKKEVPKRNDKKHEYKGYEDVGDFIVSERLETGVHVNLIFYLIIGSIGLF
ncbi:ATP-dependent zinc metalloprotease FTSH 10, mitochondrial [Glycine max]|nr:ATP-dependent zinc metalloprotease FTSH 10, mitochondrial [Glycine max]KAH1221706.1 ATP-dependent zinc metalloprotease FTSH 10, mitochondrial [Glycine max]|eukprot:XP_014620424.1 ATP-dependent zinc metalloprotease FTSH 10, mitochondrial isoform X2 [Glycine max]